MSYVMGMLRQHLGMRVLSTPLAHRLLFYAKSNDVDTCSQAAGACGRLKRRSQDFHRDMTLPVMHYRMPPTLPDH